MTVNYIEVRPVSNLFTPAVRAYGDIAIIGKGGFGTSRPDHPLEFTSPSAAAAAFPQGASILAADAAAGDTTATVAAPAVPAGTVVRIGAGRTSEVRTVTDVVADADNFRLTLDTALKSSHVSGDKVTEKHDNDLLRAIGTAFRQVPPPTRVWGVQVDSDEPGWAAALAMVEKLNVQIVMLANVALNAGNADTVGKLANHVSTVPGDGKERIGVAMFDRSLTAEDAVGLRTGAVQSERMVLVAHRSPDDVAAATAGVIAGYPPHISMLLKPISVEMTTMFDDSEISQYNDNGINWITSPALLPGRALYLGEGYTADASHNKKYIDVVRTLDDINFRIKAALIQAIGNLRISRVGLRSVVTLVESVLTPARTQGVIDDFSVQIDLLTLFDKNSAELSAAEEERLKTARSTRQVDMTVAVVYAGAIHRLKIDLVFT